MLNRLLVHTYPDIPADGVCMKLWSWLPTDFSFCRTGEDWGRIGIPVPGNLGVP